MTSSSENGMMKTAVGRLRVIGFVEGISYLVLLFVAMPLKYMMDMPVAVRITGAMHGFLFVLLCLALADAMRRARFSLVEAGGLFVASLVPFGTFVSDGWLKKNASREA